LQCTFSDFYKEVHGFRPRFASAEEWNSEAWLEQQMQDLGEEAKVVFAREEASQKQAIAAFEERVAATIAAGAQTRDTAIRWLFEAEEDQYVMGDPDYYCFNHGLPYGYFRKAA
jgi:hypothetical protein